MSTHTDRPASAAADARRRSPSRARAPEVDLGSLTYRDAIEQFRAAAVTQYLQTLLERFEGSVAVAAAHADVERESFYRLCRRFGVDPADYRAGSR